jgi:hypothetical protein
MAEVVVSYEARFEPAWSIVSSAIRAAASGDGEAQRAVLRTELVGSGPDTWREGVIALRALREIVVAVLGGVHYRRSELETLYASALDRFLALTGAGRTTIELAIETAIGADDDDKMPVEQFLVYGTALAGALLREHRLDLGPVEKQVRSYYLDNRAVFESGDQA